MAAIARKASIPLCALLLFAPSLRSGQAPAPESETGKQSAQVRAVLGAVSDDLAAGNATEALTHFEDSMTNYDTLSSYWNGLVSAFYVSNGIQILDETDEPGRTKLSVRWDLTLTDLQSYYTENRSAELSVSLVRKDGKWRISEFSPISLFDPGATPHRAKPKS